MKPLRHIGFCFECGNAGEERHHVVPKSLGGTKTVLLCSPCHGKIHGMKDRMNHRELTRQGLMRAKARGVVLGATALANLKRKTEERQANAKAYAESFRFTMEYLRGLKMPFRTMAEYFNEGNMTSPMGKKFRGKSQVHRIFKQLQE